MTGLKRTELFLLFQNSKANGCTFALSKGASRAFKGEKTNEFSILEPPVLFSKMN